MKLKPNEETVEAQTDVKLMPNGQSYNVEHEQKVDSSSAFMSGERCHRCHKEYPNNGSSQEGGASASVVVASTALKSSHTTTSVNSNTLSYKGAQSCNCTSCMERRSIEAEHVLDTQMRHAWTQIRHLVRCAYHDPLVLAAIDSEEFKTYVNLLVSEDPHLLFQRVESQSRVYVNDLKTRLLKQLTNGFNTPQLACSFVNVMFDEYARLLASARTVSSLLRQLEEEHLCLFNNVTWEQHNMHLFQSMVYSEAVVQQALTEILTQLRLGSSQHEDRRENNIFATTLIKYLKFDTEMTQISVSWRDVEKMMDDFNDERVDEKRRARRENGLNFRAQQVFSNSCSVLDPPSQQKLSLTLRQCSHMKNSDPTPISLKQEHEEEQTGVDDVIVAFNHFASVGDECEKPVQTNGEESRHDHNCMSFVLPSSQSNVVSFLHTDYLSSVKPPSVPPSDDLDDGSDDSDPPRIIEHPSLVVPSDLDEELDSAESHSPQPCNNLSHNPFLHLPDGSSTYPFLGSTRSFLPFHHPSYHPRPLRHLPKPIGTESDNPFADTACQWTFPTNSKAESSSDAEPRESFQFVAATPSNSSPTSGGLETSCGNTAQTNDTHHPTSTSPPCALAKSEKAIENKSAAAEHPHEVKPVCHNVSNCTKSLNSVDVFYKDSWSSSSSASFGSASTLNFSDHGRSKGSKYKNAKLRKKAHRKTRSTQRCSDVDSQKKGLIKVVTTEKSKEEKGSKVNGVIVENVTESGENREQPQSVLEDDDADDEYDGEDEEEMCKCDKCLATIKASHDYSNSAESKLFSLPSLDPAGIASSQTCECSACVRLAAVSFFAAQSGQPSNTLGAFSANDAASSTSVPAHFFNPIQDLRSIIHPHLYGLPTLGTTGPPVSTNEQNQASASSNSRCSTATDGSAVDARNLSGATHLFHNVAPTSPTDWDVFGKTTRDKLLLSSAPHAVPTSSQDWPVRSPQSWLSSTNDSGILPSHLVTPGTMSAIQHYLTGNHMSATHGFLQPFIPGSSAMPLGSMQHPSYLTSNDVERLFPHSNAFPGTTASLTQTATSCGNHQNSCINSPASFDATPSASNDNLPLSNASTAANLTTQSVYVPPTSVGYFSSSIYAPFPEFGGIPSSAFVPQFSQSMLSDVTSAHSGPPQIQPIRFHPGTSVSLKESQFNLSVQTNAAGGNSLFNAPIVSGASSAKANTSNSNTSYSFTSDAVTPSCPQQNPFLQHLPAYSGVGGPPTSDFTSQLSSAGTVVGLTPYTVTPGSNSAVHTQQQILRRKKLVAQSKLSRQPRSQHQLGTKTQDASSASSTPNQSPSAGMPVKLQKTPLSPCTSSVAKVDTSQKSQPLLHPNVSLTSSIPPPTSACNDVRTSSGPKKAVASQSGSSSGPVQTDAQPRKPSLPHPAASGGQPANGSKGHPHPSDSCQHVHGASNGSATRTTNSSTGTTSSTTSTTNSANGGSNCKYCNCCYCEFFGNGGPAQAPTSRNYPEMRERLLRKLKTKESKDESKVDGEVAVLESSSPASHSPDLHREPTVDELLSFIEGNAAEERSKRAAKRARQKQRKENDKRNAEVSSAGEAVIVKEPVANDVSAVVSVAAQPEKGDAVSDVKKKKNKKKGVKGEEQRHDEVKKPTADMVTTKGAVVGKVTAVCKAGDVSNNLKKKLASSTSKSEPTKLDAGVVQPKNGADFAADVLSKKPMSVHEGGELSLQSEHAKGSMAKKKIETSSKTVEALSKGDKKLDTPSSKVPQKKSEEDASNGGVPAPGKDKRSNTANQHTSRREVSEEARSGQANESAAVEEGGKDEWKKRRPLQQVKKNAQEQRKPNKQDRRETLEVEKVLKQSIRAPRRSSSKDAKAQQASSKSAAVNGLVHRKLNAISSDRAPALEKEEQRADSFLTQNQDSESLSGNNTSGASTPEKSLADNESNENRKNRSRKQRRKNRMQTPGTPGSKNAMVDQVFMPREEISNTNELDDAEKEIESFKRFCMDSTQLNKPKKITVNWKDFTFKKNLSTH